MLLRSALLLVIAFLPLSADLLSADLLPAQTAEAVGGAWISAGLGAGISEGGSAGLGFYARGGGTLAPALRAGAEVVGVTDRAVTTLNLGPMLLLQPGSTAWFLTGGAGLALATASADFDGGIGNPDEGRTGAGVTLGAGIDIALGGGLSLTPGFAALVQSFDGFADSNAGVLTLGLGFR